MKKFLKKEDLQLVNGGYLSDKDNNPVFNENFVKLQRRADFLVTFADLAKSKNFKEVKVDSLTDLKEEVFKLLNSKNLVNYVNTPEEVEKPLHKKLADEALSFMKYQESKTNADKVNSFLQEFNELEEFEKFGLFFNYDSETIKLNKLYTVEEIKNAVQSCINLL